MTRYELFFGNEIEPYIPLVSQMRIEEFKNYPYLYQGNMKYEAEYLKGFTREPRACLIAAFQKNLVVGFTTGMPLKSEVDILSEIETKFNEKNLSAATYYYFGEFIVLKEARSKGIAGEMERQISKLAKNWKYENTCLATVVRQNDHPSKPKNFVSCDNVWFNLGYEKLNLDIEYHWPMLTKNNDIEDCKNVLEFWAKKLK